MYNARMNPSVNYRFLLIITYRYWLINFNKYNMPTQCVNKKENEGIKELYGNSVIINKHKIAKNSLFI